MIVAMLMATPASVQGYAELDTATDPATVRHDRIGLGAAEQRCVPAGASDL